MRAMTPDIVLGDFNCVYGNLQGQFDYLSDLMMEKNVDHPFARLEGKLGEELNEFKGTLVEDVTSLYAEHAAFILNVGPLLRLSKYGYNIVLPTNYPVASSLRGKAWVDHVAVNMSKVITGPPTHSRSSTSGARNVVADALADK